MGSLNLMYPNLDSSPTLPELFPFLHSLLWQVELPQLEASQSRQSSDSLSVLSLTSPLKALPSLFPYRGFESGLPLSPQDYSSNLLIALHSSKESLLYFVFFLKQQSDLIPCFQNPTTWRLYPPNRQSIWRGHLAEEKNTHLHMWNVVHLHYENKCNNNIIHPFNWEFVRTW